jgi:hypothetical protein
VDDFGVKFKDRADAEHLIETLKEKYKITINWKGDSYLGLDITWDKNNRRVTICMPQYVKNACDNLGIVGPHKPRHSPAPYISPVYGKSAQIAIEDDKIDGSPLW